MLFGVPVRDATFGLLQHRHGSSCEDEPGFHSLDPIFTCPWQHGQTKSGKAAGLGGQVV
jgi:hypothetical protein